MILGEVHPKNGGTILVIALRVNFRPRDEQGNCPNPACGKPVYMSTVTLDDCYGCYLQCPHCEALTLLDSKAHPCHYARGYGGGRMGLSLPTTEEAEHDGVPDGFPLGENL
jgi:hypothetical protein